MDEENKLIRHKTKVCGLLFTSLGNELLLDRPERQLVEMSRSANQEQVAARLREVLEAAQRGAVTVTAAISAAERFIARTVREQGLPLVVLLKDGFPKAGTPLERHFMPGGVYYEACAKGSLLLLEPDVSAYADPTVKAATLETLKQKAEAKGQSYTEVQEQSMRYRFMALNEMGRLLTARNHADTTNVQKQ
jgi:hypothetical protein